MPTPETIEPMEADSIEDGNMDQLRELQQATYGNDKDKGDEKKVVIEPTAEAKPEPTPDRAERADRAAEIFAKNQKTSEKLKGQKDAEITEDPPGLKPLTAFLDSDDTEKKPEEKKPETEPSLDKENNLQNLRRIAGDFKAERNTAQARIAELEAQLAAQPPVSSALETQVATLKQRVEELTPYEAVFGLHNNPEFKAKYIDGEKALLDEMQAIITDYGVEETVVDQILAVKTRRDLDELLSENFSHASPQNDLKSLRQKLVGLRNERAREEAKPGETLAQLRERKEQEEVARNQTRDNHASQVLKEGWSLARQATLELPEEQKIYELIEVPGKKEHNETVVRPTLQNANNLLSQAVGHVEFLIRNQGMPSRGFVAWLGQLCQQAAASQMLRSSRYGLYEKYEALRTQSEKQNNYDRPGLNGNGRAPTQVADPNKKLTTEEKLANTFLNVVQRGENA